MGSVSGDCTLPRTEAWERAAMRRSCLLQALLGPWREARDARGAPSPLEPPLGEFLGIKDSCCPQRSCLCLLFPPLRPCASPRAPSAPWIVPISWLLPPPRNSRPPSQQVLLSAWLLLPPAHPLLFSPRPSLLRLHCSLGSSSSATAPHASVVPATPAVRPVA